MRSLLYIVIVLLISGCSISASQNRSLDEVAALIQSDPNAAMEKLNTYDVTRFSDSATMARWALLYSEALVANRITAPTDTIINIAIDYYGSHNLKDEFRHASRLKSIIMSSGEANKLGQALYLQKEKEFLLYKERVKFQQIVFVGALILLIAIGVIIWQRQRLKIKEEKNRSLIAEASALMHSLSRNESLRSDLQAKLGNLFCNRFAIIDELCQTYYETQGTKVERKAIVEQVKSRIEELQSDSGIFAEMESCVNDCYDGLLDKLRHDMPQITIDDYRLSVYMACNLSNRSIAALLGENINVVYKRKSRLKAKISLLDSPDAALYQAVFR